MKGLYLRQVYRGNHLLKNQLVKLPIDLDTWKVSIYRDKRDGIKCSYRSVSLDSTKYRVVVRVIAKDSFTGLEYILKLIDVSDRKIYRELKQYIRGGKNER